MNVVAEWFPEKKGLAVGMVIVGFGIALPILSYPFKYPTDIDFKNMKRITIMEKNIKNMETIILFSII